MARGCTTGPCGPGRSRARSWYGARNDALDPTGGHGGVRRRSRVLGVAARHLASTVAAAILDVHRCVRRGWWPASADVVCGREVPRLGAARSDLGAVGGRHAAAGGRALGLELRYTKREILEAYLNLVPYGGNLEGAAAASLIYFGKDPSRLTLSEALTLAVLPQNPTRRAPNAGGGERQARDL